MHSLFSLFDVLESVAKLCLLKCSSYVSIKECFLLFLSTCTVVHISPMECFLCGVFLIYILIILSFSGSYVITGIDENK